MQLQKKEILRGVHEMRSKIKKCEQVYIWDVTPPSLPSLAQAAVLSPSNRPNGATFGCLDALCH